MKIIAAFLMALMLLACPAWASTVPKESSEIDASFSYTQLEGLPGYKYDKFDRSWIYQAKYELKDSGYAFRLMFRISGDPEIDTYPYMQIVAKKDNETITIKEVKILVNDTVYHYSNLGTLDDSTYLEFGNMGRVMLDNMIQNDSISYKLYYYGNTVTFDVDSIDTSCPQIKEWATNLEVYRIWDKITVEQLSDVDSKYFISAY